MSRVAELRELAWEVATINPTLGRKILLLSAAFKPMEEILDELTNAARDAEWREYVEAQGVVAVGKWGVS